jgi:hypothetical protein
MVVNADLVSVPGAALTGITRQPSVPVDLLLPGD